MEGDQIFGNFEGRRAPGRLGGVDEAVVGVGGVPGEADEYGEGEEGVDIDDAVERRNVDAGGRHLRRRLGNILIYCVCVVAEIARRCARGIY